MNYPIVLVTWFDAKDGSSGWHSIEDVKKEKLATCYSTGWLVHHDNERVVILADYSNEEMTTMAVGTSRSPRDG